MIKTLKEHLFGFVLLFSVVLSVNAQWKKTSIYGGVIVSIAVSDSTILAGTQQGNVFRSGDNGNTWSQIMSLDYRSWGTLRSLEINSDGIYVDYLSFGMEYATAAQMFSGDGGKSWSAISYAFPHSYITARAVCGTTLFAAVEAESSMVYQSTDNGISWSAIAFDLQNARIASIAVDDSIVIVNVMDSDGIISTDSGKTWRTLTTGRNDMSVLSIAASNGMIFAATRNGILKSTNNGRTWTYDSVALSGITALVAKDSMLFAGTNNGVYRSIDKGVTWNAINSGLNNLYVFAIATKGETLFAGTNGDGVFRSADNGVTWLPVNYGIKNEYITSLAAKGNAIFAGSRFGGIVYSSDNGENWVAGNAGLNLFGDIRCLTTNKSSIFAGSSYNGLFRSDNNGATWSATNAAVATTFITLVADDSCIVASSILDGLLRSTDKGNSWVKVDSGFYFTDFTAAMSESGTMFIGIQYNRCYISIDQGRSWSYKNPVPSEFREIVSVAAFKNSIYAGTYNGIVRSSDTGATWTAINTGLPPTRVLDLAVSGSMLFAGTDSGCFVFDALTDRWSALSSNLPSGAINCLAATDSMLFATTSDGIWRHQLPAIVSVKDRQSREPGLHNIFFGMTVFLHSNKSAVISCSLEQANHLTLSIYNLQGRLVTTLADTYLRPGVYKYKWNPQAISLGNYYVKMQVGENAFVKCIMVVGR